MVAPISNPPASLAEDDVFTAIRGIITAYLAAVTVFNGVQVVRANQPTNQGAVAGPALYLTIFPMRRYGFTGAAYTDTNPAQAFLNQTLTQNVEMDIQLQASVPVFASQTPSTFKATDLLLGVLMQFESDAVIETLRGAGITVLRTSEMQAVYFTNEAGQIESVPTAVVTAKYNVQALIPVQAISAVSGKIIDP